MEENIEGVEPEWEMMHVPFFDRFKFRNIRTWKGMTQGDLCEVMGVGKAERIAVGKWENGTRIPRLSSIRRAAKAFGVRSSDLMSTHDELTRSEEIYEKAMKARGYMQADATIHESRRKVIQRQTTKAKVDKADRGNKLYDDKWHQREEQMKIAKARRERMEQFAEFAKKQTKDDEEDYKAYPKFGELDPES